MVGFKTIWLLLILLVLGACVPQTKQTECKSNEAFNAALRTCVPVVNGPSSFINIDSFLPTSPLTKYKNDTNPVTFSIVISNPYAQTYTVSWERIYNGVPVTLAPSTPTSYSFAPALLSTELGTHIIAVKIRDANNAIVDSHSFEIKINDNPRPVIDSATVTPAMYNNTFTPYDVNQNFQFTVKNNGATMAGAGYRTDWTLYKDSTIIDTETDNFPTTSPVGSLSSTGFNYPVYVFSPSVLGAGNYTVRARVTNTAAEVVAEQQWTATVVHPPLAKVSSRNIYSIASGNSVAYTQVSTAYNGVPYTSSTTYNMIPGTFTPGVPPTIAQGNYCVTLTSGEGSYVGDSQFVYVDYYIDGSTFIYRGTTSAVDPEICLSDSPAALATFLFTNPTTTAAYPHTLVARVIDQRTNAEYTASDMNTGLGTYPITWAFTVKPQNAAPTVSFGTMTGLTCPGSSTNTKSACTVASDTNFTVRINMTSDDFYTTALNEANFDYSIVLYRNNVPYQTCSKSDPGYTGATDVNGTDGYECIFNIESYDGSGPINLNAQTYKITAEITDNGSPIVASGMTSATLNWVFAANGVSETNTAPTISSWSVSGAVNEGAAISFSADIVDAQRDNHTYDIKYCTNVGCTTPVTLTSGTITRTTSTNPYSLAVNYTLPEDFLLNLTALGCNALKRTQTCAINFFITVTDVPNTATPGTVSSSQAASVITNVNPAPTLNTAFSVPAPSTFTALTAFAFVGMPISFTNTPAAILADTSAVVAEKTYRYQWYVKNNTSVTTYQAIDGANGNNLVWTPSLIKEANLATDNPLSIILCVEDHPAAAVATPNPTDSTCNQATPWVVTVRNNVAVAHDISLAPSSTELATTGTDTGNESAIWYDTPSTFNSVTSSAAYIATIGNDQRIHVKKVLVVDRGQINTINATQIVSIYPVPSGTVHSVKDLSITGNGNELYIAYLASRTGTPSSFYPQVRRIDLSSTIGKSVPNNHAGKFGFDYDGLAFTNSCSPAADCPTTAASGVTSITFSPSGASITGTFILGTPNGNFTVDFGTYDAIDTICSTCTGGTMAQNLTDIINTSTNPLLAGYSASVAGSTVTINGAQALDYFDASTDTNARIADRQGKIYISGGNWYIPFIDNTLGGSYNDKLSVYSASTGANMSSFAEGIMDPNSTGGLAAMDAAIKFDNYLEGSNLWISMVSKTGSAGKLYRVDSTSFALLDSDPLFTGTALLDTQIAASSTNVFVGVTAAVGNTLKLGVYNNNGTMLDEFNIDNPANVDASSDTIDFFNTSDIASYRILPYGTEARLYATSKGLTASNYKLYTARLRAVSSVWTLSCGDCTPISEIGQDVSRYVSLGVAPIRDNPSALYRLSTDGAVSNQGIKDVAFVSFGRLDSASATTCDPAIGVFNVEGEAIGATTSHTGTNPNEDSGLYRAPLIKN